MKKRNYHIVCLAQCSPWVTIRVIEAEDFEEAEKIFNEKYRTNEEYIVLSEEQWNEAYNSLVNSNDKHGQN